MLVPALALQQCQAGNSTAKLAGRVAGWRQCDQPCLAIGAWMRMSLYMLHRSNQAPLLLCCLEQFAYALEGVIATVRLSHKPAGDSTTHSIL
jgi:hypothetical protein